METRPLVLSASEVLEIIKNYVEDHNVFGKRRQVQTVSFEEAECVVTFKEEKSSVWHLRTEYFKNQELRFPLYYECVAKVQSTDLNWILDCTTSIEADAFQMSREWWESRWCKQLGEVECIKKSRSTGIGDVIVMPDKKTLFLCLPTGWGEYHGIPQIFTTGVINKGYEP